MKVVVIKKFKDKETGEIRKVGDVFTCKKKRYEEITKAGDYVKEYDETADDVVDETADEQTEE